MYEVHVVLSGAVRIRSIAFDSSVKARRWAACVAPGDGIKVILVRHEEEIVAKAEEKEVARV